jgi:hypothetical protein
MIRRSTVLSAMVFSAGISAFAQYKMEPIEAPPAEAPAEYAGLVQKTGYRVSGPAGPSCEVWFRTSLPAGPKTTEEAVVYPTIPQGAFLGLIRFPAKGADRRGQSLKPGLYTMRYAIYPINGDHQGIAPQRDFAVLSPIAEDKDPNSLPAFDPLIALSRKASGTPHPAVLSLELPPSGAKAPGLVQEGEKDWSLTVTVGGTPVAIIVVGKSDA